MLDQRGRLEYRPDLAAAGDEVRQIPRSSPNSSYSMTGGSAGLADRSSIVPRDRGVQHADDSGDTGPIQHFHMPDVVGPSGAERLCGRVAGVGANDAEGRKPGLDLGTRARRVHLGEQHGVEDSRSRRTFALQE